MSRLRRLHSFFEHVKKVVNFLAQAPFAFEEMLLFLFRREEAE